MINRIDIFVGEDCPICEVVLDQLRAKGFVKGEDLFIYAADDSLETVAGLQEHSDAVGGVLPFLRVDGTFMLVRDFLRTITN